MVFLNALQILTHTFVCRRKQLVPVYKQLCLSRTKGANRKPKTGKKVILLVRNDTTFCGGLSDRFRGIISVYQECKRQGLDFRIHFETPNLADYLEPNEYDWYIKEEDVCYDTKRVYPCTILTYHTLEDKKEPEVQRSILRWFIKKHYDQIHVYTNMRSGDNEYSKLFHELFKPTNDLQLQLNYHLEKLGGAKNYQAMVFRFRQLLGDFKEGGETLPDEEREPYISRCIDTIENMHQQSTSGKILVTSDSGTFLQRMAALPYVYTIPGEVVHIGFTYNAAKNTYMKSFVDYFVLSYAWRVTLVRDKKMYHSGFALRAAMLNDAEYHEAWM